MRSQAPAAFKVTSRSYSFIAYVSETGAKSPTLTFGTYIHLLCMYFDRALTQCSLLIRWHSRVLDTNAQPAFIQCTKLTTVKDQVMHRHNPYFKSNILFPNTGLRYLQYRQQRKDGYPLQFNAVPHPQPSQRASIVAFLNNRRIQLQFTTGTVFFIKVSADATCNQEQHHWMKISLLFVVISCEF